MKKLLMFLGLVGLATSLQAGQGGQYTTQRFINGQFLIVSNNTTVEPLLLMTNVFYVDDKNLGRWSYMNTNFVATVGQSGTNYIPAAFYWTNNANYSQTNALAGGWTTNSQTINPPALNDITGIVDANGLPSASASIYVTAYGLGSRPDQAGAPTNTCTFTFTKSGNGTDFTTGNNGVINQDYMLFAFTAPEATNRVFMTNVPSIFLQGARKIRVAVTTSNVTSGTNIVFSDISMTGWVP